MTSEDIYIEVKEAKYDSEKIYLIEKYVDNISSELLGSLIGILLNIENVFNITDKYIDKLDSDGIEFIIHARRKDNEKNSLIEKYAYKLDIFDLGFSIGSIKDINVCIKMINKYISSDTNGIECAISERKKDKDRIKLIKKYIDILDEYDLGLSIGSIEDLNLAIKMIDKNIDKLSSNGIKNVILGRKNNQEKIVILKKYVDKIDKKDLDKIISSIDSIFIESNNEPYSINKLLFGTKKRIISTIATGVLLMGGIIGIASFKSNDSKEDSSSTNSSSTIDEMVSSDSSEEDNYTEEGYYIAPDDTLWINKSEYEEYINAENNNSFNDCFLAPDGTLWKTEDDYNLYIKYNNPKFTYHK